jgi:hypothetical protein
MKDQEEVIKGFNIMMRRISGRSNIMAGTVLSVNDAELTINVMVDGLTYFDVRLSANNEKPAGNSFIVPVVGSWVLFGFVDGSETDGFVLMFSECEKIITRATEVVFNDGKNEGLVKVIELTKRLNAIEKEINDLKTVFKTWVVAPTDGGGALKAALAKWFAIPMETTKQNKIENTNIKH